MTNRKETEDPEYLDEINPLELLTLEQVANTVQIESSLILEMLEKHEMPGFKIQGQWRIRKLDLADWMLKQIGEENIEEKQQAESLPLIDISQSEHLATRIPLIPTKQGIPGTIIRYKLRNQTGHIILEDGRKIFFRNRSVEDIKAVNVGDIVEVILGSGSSRPRPNYLTEAKQVFPLQRYKKVRSIHVEDYYRRASDQRGVGMYDEARKNYEGAIKEGAFLSVFLDYAEMEKQLANFHGALAIIERGLQTFPYVDLLFEKASQLYLTLERNDLAIALLRRGYELLPKNPGTAGRLIEVLYASGTDQDVSSAIDVFMEVHKQGLSLDQSSKAINLIRIMSRSERAKLAQKLFRAGNFEVRMLKGQDGKWLDLVLTTDKIEYLHSYALQGKILARCFRQKPKIADINSLRQEVLLEEWDVSLNQAVAFAILPRSEVIQHALRRDNIAHTVTIVPFDDANIETGMRDDAYHIIDKILRDWLSHRDLYKANFPVLGRDFFGRDLELQSLLKDIEFGNHTGVFGLRKTGKTSLLHKLEERCYRDLIVYIDLQHVNESTCDHLYWAIAVALRKQLEKKYPQIALQLNLSLGDVNVYSAAQKRSGHIKRGFDHDLMLILDRTQSLTPKPRIVIALDELEWMLPTAKDEGFDGYLQFFAYLRGVAQNTRGRLVSVVTAANSAVCENPVWQGRDNPVFSFYQIVYLPPLSENECNKMIEELGKRMGITYDPKSLNEIYALTNGHPFLTRMFCSYLIKVSDKNPLHISPSMVSENTDNFILEVGSTILNEILNRFESHFPEERDILLFIADGVDYETELFSLMEKPIDAALRHLIGYSLIEKKNSRFKIRIELLKRWLRLYRLGRMEQ